MSPANAAVSPSARADAASTRRPGVEPRTVRVALAPARGLAGASPRRLYETLIDGEPYLVWETRSGRLRATKARCPHRPQRATLHLRAILEGDTLLCAVHGNAYSAETGRCVVAAGPDDPGRLTLLSGWRDGDHAVLVRDE